MRSASDLLARSAMGQNVDQSLLDDVVTGLRRSPRELAPVWLYDEAGSQLFDMICELPEYYLTRAELQIMTRHADEVAEALGPGAAIVEFGSGTSAKTRLLLDHLESPAVYVPVDIADIHLLEGASGIARDYPALPVVPLRADFTKPLMLPSLAKASARRVIYFPGSTIGNFAPLDAYALLQSMSDLVGRNGAILIGVDLTQDISVMERAYNDPAGITARFNLNALRHVSRVLGANFPLSAFEHRAPWITELNRIEMRLLCKRDLELRIASEFFEIQHGDYIRTECCHKYTSESFAGLAAAVGLQVRRTWLDQKKQFSVQLLEPVDAGTPRDYWSFVKELARYRLSLESLTHST